jgi:hypothetical protein
MAYSDERGEDVETTIAYHDNEEVNAQACQQIEADERPYLLITKSEKDPEKPFQMGLLMGNGIDTLTEARDLLVSCLDQIDLAMLQYREGE